MGKIQILDVTAVAEKRRDNGAETVFENTMAGDFPKFMDIKLQI